MEVFHNIDITQPLPKHLKGGVIAIGNFDGIHCGHHAILQHAINIADGAPTIVLLFNPHPRTILKPDIPVFTLIPQSVQPKILKNMGLSALIRYHFTAQMADYSADTFVQKILVEWLEAKQVITGNQFRFGKNRSGDKNFLQRSGKEYGFSSIFVDELRDDSCQIISSSRIRQALNGGKVKEASQMLGYHFTVESEVVHGKKLGRKLGFPTANMKLTSAMSLKEGVYTIRFRTPDNKSYCGIANFGRSPTITQNGPLLLESFLFNFSKEIYGQICTVSFFDFLRSEIKCQDLDELKEYMRADERKAHELLAKDSPLSDRDLLICF
ncbi:MAG: bifunctional riboflavin kinase/FAD synthetase [Candidatus Liberibacter ctenarytainae]|uniref:Riboflavin biosynthesis protein n=1 Tax=Candidatus Liberibacter ctenarytainae TaxID=2020335 RepID=A0A937DJ53_9HYPH|nr:bifunctional riboflavin kinase/FAD synthetase [Candidatus Liberibacter ctenarytainae]